MNITYGSVCSGIEAASVAWEPLGWKPWWFAESEKFPSAVLKHHWPRVPNLGDMTKIPHRCNFMDAAPDVLVGGCPCQAFSIAGKRESLLDARGNLTLTYIEVANALDRVRQKQGKRDVIIVYENVPGILTTADNAFGCFVAGLVGGCRPAVPSASPDGKRGNTHWKWSNKADHLVPRWPNAGWVVGPQRTVAWRVMDAQWQGVAQRRRRVFLIGCSRSSGIDPRAILFEPQSMCRDTPPSREAGEETTHDVAPSIGASGRGFSRAGETRGQDPVVAVSLRGREGGGSAEIGGPVSPSLRASQGGGDKQHIPAPQVGIGETLLGGSRQKGGFSYDDIPQVAVFGGNNTAGPLDRSPALNAKGGSGRMDFESEALCVTGRGVPTVAGPLCAHQPRHGHAMTTQQAAESNHLVTQVYTGDGKTADPVSASEGKTYTHEGSFNFRLHNRVDQSYRVRRLTPIECERLQGFPDDHTADIPHEPVPAKGQAKARKLMEAGDKKFTEIDGVIWKISHADGPRYRAIGNSMAVPCMRWIGTRIEQVLRNKP